MQLNFVKRHLANLAQARELRSASKTVAADNLQYKLKQVHRIMKQLHCHQQHACDDDPATPESNFCMAPNFNL